MDPSDLHALPAVALLAGEPGVHAVGGAVRDLLLGGDPHEVDFVVEGDALAVARRLGGTVRTHDRFGTATVRAGGLVFDLVSARRETYPRPGALPEVELGASLDEDLARRDFTVNAIAARVADGELRSVPGAAEDLAAGVLRVLHDGSFADDPTRLLRLARYAARLGFAPDPETARLAAAATVGTVTPGRLGAELRLLLREPQPDALLALAERGLGEQVLGAGFAADAGRIDRVLAQSPPDARADLAALASTVTAVPARELADRLRALAFPRRDAETVVEAAAGRGLEGAVLRAAEGDAAAARWLSEDRHRRLAITGDDLLAAGLSGPAIGRALAAARAAMLEGRAPDRDAQLTVALSA